MAGQEASYAFSIPIHGNRPLKIGLLRHLATLADIPDRDLQ